MTVTQKELDALRRDAARYIYLREFTVSEWGKEGRVSFSFPKKLGLDAAVDKAIGNVDGPGFEDQNTSGNIFIDACRYRWLRDVAPANFPLGPYVVGCPAPDELDALVTDAIVREST